VEPSERDNLTKLYNERGFKETVDKEIVRSRRYGRMLALLTMKISPHPPDVKNYESYPVLKKCSQVVNKLIRNVDIAGRVSDKLVLAIPETSETGAMGTVTRILDNLRGLHFKGEGYDYEISCEIGMSLFPGDGETVDELLKAADKALVEKPNKT